MNVGDALSRLPGYSHALLVVPDEEGYPLSVATSFTVVDGTVEVTPASTGPSAVRDTVEARLVVSHIRPYPGVGYDQRRYFVQTGQYALRPLSIPVAILVMLILYANEVPDRFADAKAGKRTLVVRMPPAAVIRGYVVAAAVAYLVVIAGDSPYQLMSYLGKNVNLHLFTGVLLVIASCSGSWSAANPSVESARRPVPRGQSISGGLCGCDLHA
jgi:hypothetical protein